MLIVQKKCFPAFLLWKCIPCSIYMTMISLFYDSSNWPMLQIKLLVTISTYSKIQAPLANTHTHMCFEAENTHIADCKTLNHLFKGSYVIVIVKTNEVLHLWWFYLLPQCLTLLNCFLEKVDSIQNLTLWNKPLGKQSNLYNQ